MKVLVISKREAGQRLDKHLLRFLDQSPKSFIYKMLRKKNITLNGKKADGSEKLNENDEIKLFLADETITKFSKKLVVEEEIPLDIIYEDRDVIFVNKPAGVLSQKSVASDISMNEYLISYLVGSGSITTKELESFHPAVCNRLDRNTSGLLLAGKSMIGLQELSLMLKLRSLQKFYLCLVAGVIESDAHIKGYLIKDKNHNKVKVSDSYVSNSSLIETAYSPLCNNGEVTLLKVELITGRTHQIRSHLAAIAHPIIGDSKYGNNKVNKLFKEKYDLKCQLLHAWRVSFGNLEGALSVLAGRKFEALLPKRFENIIKAECLEEYNE